MCRNITELRGLEPAATAEEIEAAARQYVRKVSGVTRPTAPTPMRSRPPSPRSPRPPRGCWPVAAAPAAAEDRAAAASPRGAGPASRPEVDYDAPALKEWSAAVHAMLDGRQTVLLRKGGIHEKRFDLAAREFLLLPDGRARPRRAGASRAPRSARRRGPDSTEQAIVVRAGAKVVAAFRSTGRRGSPTSPTLHIWTAESVRADRLDFRPKHRLTVLVVQARPLVYRCCWRAPRLRRLHELGGAAGRRDWGHRARQRDTGGGRRPGARSVA